MIRSPTRTHGALFSCSRCSDRGSLSFFLPPPQSASPRIETARILSPRIAQEVEIDIDSLDLHTFLKVDKYVQDCIARARKKQK